MSGRVVLYNSEGEALMVLSASIGMESNEAEVLVIKEILNPLRVLSLVGSWWKVIPLT